MATHPRRFKDVIRCTYRPNNGVCTTSILLPQFYVDGRIVCYYHWCDHLISKSHPPLCSFRTYNDIFDESSASNEGWTYYATCTENNHGAVNHHDQCAFSQNNTQPLLLNYLFQESSFEDQSATEHLPQDFKAPKKTRGKAKTTGTNRQSQDRAISKASRYLKRETEDPDFADDKSKRIAHKNEVL